MSTYQLASAMESAQSPHDGEPRPSPRLLQRMAQEWDERPDQDRFAALALLQDRT